MPLIEYIAGMATVIVINRIYEEIYWRRQDLDIEYYPPRRQGESISTVELEYL